MLIVFQAGVFNVPEEEIAKIGKLTNSTVRLPEESGGQYMASIEAVHQLHCLVCHERNLLYDQRRSNDVVRT